MSELDDRVVALARELGSNAQQGTIEELRAKIAELERVERGWKDRADELLAQKRELERERDEARKELHNLRLRQNAADQAAYGPEIDLAARIRAPEAALREANYLTQTPHTHLVDAHGYRELLDRLAKIANVTARALLPAARAEHGPLPPTQHEWNEAAVRFAIEALERAFSNELIVRPSKCVPPGPPTLRDLILQLEQIVQSLRELER